VTDNLSDKLRGAVRLGFLSTFRKGGVIKRGTFYLFFYHIIILFCNLFITCSFVSLVFLYLLAHNLCNGVRPQKAHAHQNTSFIPAHQSHIPTIARLKTAGTRSRTTTLYIQRVAIGGPCRIVMCIGARFTIQMSRVPRTIEAAKRPA